MRVDRYGVGELGGYSRKEGMMSGMERKSICLHGCGISCVLFRVGRCRVRGGNRMVRSGIMCTVGYSSMQWVCCVVCCGVG